MQNNRFLKELKAGLPNSFYFLYSKESFLLEEALARIIETVIPPSQSDFNYTVFYPTSGQQEIFDTLYTLPFSAPRRLVVLKDFHQFPSSQVKALISYLKKPNEKTCLLLLSQKEPKSNLELGPYLFSFKIKDSDLPEWLKHTADRKGIKISGSAVDYLIEAIGTDIGLLAAEIEKLSLSGGKTIDKQDIIASTGNMREYTVFNLVDALINNQRTSAFKILKRLSEGKPSAAPAILGALNWHYKGFYTLWENKGKKPHKMKQDSYKVLLKQLPCVTEESFHDIFRSLHKADIGIKSSGRPELALEILLINLLQARTKN